MEPVIRTEGLTRRFGTLLAVDGLTVEVAPGEIFGLVGPDGAGKTTTLRLLCGLLDATSGEARVAGHDVARETAAVKDSIGYMAQRFGLYGDLTVDENMQFYADLFNVTGEERGTLAQQLLRMTRMEPFRARQAGRLSGGMKQKLALMCTLLHRPRILLLDEPTNGVDPVSRRDFWAILYQLVKDGITIFITTAYLDEAERCNRVGMMHRGKLVRCAPPDALKRELANRCFLVQAPDQRAAREVLRSQEGVHQVERSGVSLHVFLKPGVSPKSLTERLRAEGHGEMSLTSAVPSLEDVFIAVVGAEEGAHV